MGLRFEPGVQEFVRTLAPGPKRRVRKACDLIGFDPRHKKLDIKRLRTKDEQTYYRCRVGDYRIVYTPVKGGAVIWKIFHRADGYEWMELFGR